MKKTSFLLCILICISNVFGQMWTQIGFTNKGVLSLATNGNYIYAGAVDGLYPSSDNGQSWIHSLNNGNAVLAMGVFGSEVFAGCNNNGVFRSTNNGFNWVQTSLTGQYVYSIAVNGQNVYAGVEQNLRGIYFSTDYGQTWTHNLNYINIYGLLIDGSDIFAGTNTGVLLSTNSGYSWNSDGLNGFYINTFAMNGLYVLAGGSSGLFYTSNNGINWIQSNLTNQDVTSIAVSGINIFAGTISSGIFFTSNSGQNWVQLNQGLTDLNIRSLAIKDNFVFAGTNSNGLWRRNLNEILGISLISNQIPKSYKLSQNYPNPFNPSTIIKYDLPKEGMVKIVVYDAIGREVKTLVNEEQNAGSYKVEFDGSNLPSGIYFYKLQAGDFTETKKMLLIK